MLPLQHGIEPFHRQPETLVLLALCVVLVKPLVRLSKCSNDLHLRFHPYLLSHTSLLGLIYAAVGRAAVTGDDVVPCHHCLEANANDDVTDLHKAVRKAVVCVDNSFEAKAVRGVKAQLQRVTANAEELVYLHFVSPFFSTKHPLGI